MTMFKTTEMEDCYEDTCKRAKIAMGAYLKSIREAQGLTRRELAESVTNAGYLCVNQQNIGAWENEAPMSLPTLLLVCAVYRISMQDYVLEYEKACGISNRRLTSSA